jgi:hypothetical protein
MTRPKVPPPGPHGLGPVERPLAIALRAHRAPQPFQALAMRLPGLKQRAIKYHLARWLACGLVEATELAPGWPAYRWSPTAPSAPAFDALPLLTCPKCATGPDREGCEGA